MDDRAAPNSGRINGHAHLFPVRVYYEDTDAAGIVYYANYFKFAERARTEMMHLLDGGYKDKLAARELAFAVCHCEADFLAPAKLDDVLEISTRVIETGGASLTAEQVIRRGTDELTRIRVRLACVDKNGRAMRIPAGIKSALESVTQD